MRARVAYACGECGHSAPKWEGRCPQCGAWDSYVEEAVRTPARGRAAVAPLAPGATFPVLLGDVAGGAERRMPVSIGELDRVLGGGIVRGSVVLISGDPGIGKSTLLLQLSAALAGGAESPNILYVSGEESLQQLRLRADRLGLADAPVLAMASNDLVEVLAQLERVKPDVAVIDSVQTLSDPELASAPGSVAQVREVASRVMALCKATGTAAFLVGHVNKEGAIAGPRVLEHIVDAVLHLEGDSHGALRLLRSQKNRFGSTEEIGIFEMRDEGLREAGDPARAFFHEASLRAPGATVFPAVEGTRPLMVEIQSLVSPTPFGLPRRSATGVELNRVHMLLAVLEKRAGLALSQQDVYVNVVGGIRLNEPAADLALALSVAANIRNQPISAGLVAAGEVGLAGEVRDARQLERRLTEAGRMGFTRALVGSRAAALLPATFSGITIEGVADVREAIERGFG